MRNLTGTAGLLAVVALLVSQTGAAQDITQVNPRAKVLLENDRVRVIEARLAPGGKEAMHSHPDRVIYPFTSYTVKHTTKDGKASVDERKAGVALWAPATVHAGENVGKTEVHLLVIELKEPPRSQR